MWRGRDGTRTHTAASPDWRSWRASARQGRQRGRSLACFTIPLRCPKIGAGSGRGPSGILPAATLAHVKSGLLNRHWQGQTCRLARPDFANNTRWRRRQSRMKCGSGAIAEIGRQARLRIWWRKPCGFESRIAHLTTLRTRAGPFKGSARAVFVSMMCGHALASWRRSCAYGDIIERSCPAIPFRRDEAPRVRSHGARPGRGAM